MTEEKSNISYYDLSKAEQERMLQTVYKNTPYDLLSSDQKALVDSPIIESRLWAAVQGFGMEILIKDDDVDVRSAVADNRFGLDQLVFDSDKELSTHAILQIAKDLGLDDNAQTVSLRDWVLKNPEKIANTEIIDRYCRKTPYKGHEAFFDAISKNPFTSEKTLSEISRKHDLAQAQDKDSAVSLADRAADTKEVSADMAQDAPQRSVDKDAR